ncbi:conserved hypothetical protein [Culex quinquefasciatus]|uniref:Zinc finger PHD-type domain-containing protein n=1 Tax=Culex quinquefasciatus TaxID=7176 RepID=B0WV43_CULQU|nr:conserved hypothetical protein [Culex quinquefasciatus]|eukprot:XP_001860847.1 conserved hypothetical protein [Culex quinquefasciatus]
MSDEEEIICASCEKKNCDPKKGIGCCHCHKWEHFKCKNVLEKAISKLRSKPYFCSDGCLAANESVPRSSAVDAELLNRMNELMSEVKCIKNTVTEIEKSQTFISGEFDKLMKEMVVLKKDHNNLTKNVGDLYGKHQTVNTKVSQLELEVDRLARAGLTNNMVILGLPSTKDEDASEWTSRAPAKGRQSPFPSAEPGGFREQLVHLGLDHPRRLAPPRAITVKDDHPQAAGLNRKGGSPLGTPASVDSGAADQPMREDACPSEPATPAGRPSSRHRSRKNRCRPRRPANNAASGAEVQTRSQEQRAAASVSNNNTPPPPFGAVPAAEWRLDELLCRPAIAGGEPSAERITVLHLGDHPLKCPQKSVVLLHPNVGDLVRKVATSVGYNLPEGAIKEAKRLFPKDKNNTRATIPIKVTFSDERIKEGLFAGKKARGQLLPSSVDPKFGSSNSRIMLRDEMTSFGMNLLKETREAEYRLQVHLAWA